MNEKKLIDITQELRELYPNLEKESEEKVLQVFQSLQEIQKKSLPNPAFRKTLKEKLHTLHDLGEHTPLSEIQSQRFSLSLLSGLFASFIFIAGFLYVMQGVLFQNPITNQPLKLSTLTGEQLESIETVESIAEDAPDNILKAEDVLFNGVTNPYQTSPGTPENISDISSDSSAQDSPQDTISNTPQSDTSLSIDSDVQDFSSENNETDTINRSMMKTSPTPAEDTSQDTVEPEQGALFMELMMSDTPAETQIDSFGEYCRAQGGSFNTSTRVCSKGQNTCNETQYNSGNCNLDDSKTENIQTDTPEEKSTSGGL